MARKGENICGTLERFPTREVAATFRLFEEAAAAGVTSGIGSVKVRRKGSADRKNFFKPHFSVDKGLP
jgi:hypothetical protein